MSGQKGDREQELKDLDDIVKGIYHEIIRMHPENMDTRAVMALRGNALWLARALRGYIHEVKNRL